jgi:tol-pal system protein YbgF
LRKEISDLRRKLEAAAQEKAEQRSKIEELTNQVLILQDKLEQAAAPVRPAGPARPQVIRVQPAPEPAERTVITGDDADVEYAGEARDTRSPRPVLRIEGANARRGMVPVEPEVVRPEARPRTRQGRRVALAPPPTTGERLPVVPLPDGGVPTKPTAHAGAARAAAPAPAAAASPTVMYQRAMDALRRKAHAEAAAGFRELLKSWPRHELAQNAQYWLAETYYDQADYTTALAEFRRVVQKHPSGNKAPDALLKAGYCHAKLGDAKNARNLLGQVVELYPKSAAARLATDRLRALR